MRLNDQFPSIPDINLDSEVIKFFLKNGLYIPRKTNKVDISYKAIANNFEIPEVYFKEEKAIALESTFIDDATDEKEIEIEKKAIDAINNSFGNPTNYDNYRKQLMINGYTLPIRINLSQQLELFKESYYVKQPDFNRVLGLYLYNIISDKGIPFRFNEAGIIESGIKANTARLSNEKQLIQISEYQHGIARADIHADFLGMQYDAVEAKNRLVDNNYNSIICDFNIVFEDDAEDSETIVGKLNEISFENTGKGFIDKDIATIILQEKKAVAERLINNFGTLKALSDIIGNQKINDYENSFKTPREITVNKKLEKYMGASNLINYVAKKIEQYSK